MLEGLCEKYQGFKDKLETFDTEIFINIPMIMLLRRINNEDKDICNQFLPELTEEESPISKQFLQCRDILVFLNKQMENHDKENEGLQKNYRSSNHLMFQYKTLLKPPSKQQIQKKSMKNIGNKIYNFIEKIILTEDDQKEKIIKSQGFALHQAKINEALKLMRILSFEIQRKNPQEWNEFIDIGMQKQVQEVEYVETENQN